MPNEVYAHVAFLGIVVQTLSALLLAAVFVALRRLTSDRESPRTWLRDWTVAFLGLAVALGALFVRYLLANDVASRISGDFGNADQPLPRALYFAYQAGKFTFFGFLASGCARFAGRVARVPWRALGVLLLAWAAWSAFTLRGLNAIVAAQTPVAIVATLAAGVLVLGAPRERRSLGTRLVGLVCLLLALLWSIYAWSFTHRSSPAPFLRETLAALARYNSFVDVLVQSMLGLGMLVTVFQDLARATEATRAERSALQARLLESRNLERLGAVVSGVAHELNNPLTAILGYSEELLGPAGGTAAGESSGGTAQESLRVIHEQAQRCRAIVRDLLGFARPRRPSPEPIEPAALLRRVVAGFAPELRRARVTVDVIAGPGLATLHADAIGLEQVLANLIDNAIDASPPGAVIAVSARTCGAEGKPGEPGASGEQCELAVEDEGPGVAAESAERIFEPFFTTKASHGTGLGLAVSHRIVTAHGGTIRAERRADGRPGARFVVRLPVEGALPADAELVARASAGVAATPARAAADAPRLLLIDDDDAVRALVRRRFAQHGFDVVEAHDGADAIAKARASHRPFDVAISDVRMRGISGLALYEELVRAAPGLAQRFVAITGDLLAPEVSRIAAASRCQVFEKPLDLERLVGCVGALAAGAVSRPVAQSA